MNTLIVAGSMALLAVVGFIYFKYQEKRENRHEYPIGTD